MYTKLPCLKIFPLRDFQKWDWRCMEVLFPRRTPFCKWPHPIKQRRDELRKIYFFVSQPLWWRLLILVDSCSEWGWPDTLPSLQPIYRQFGSFFKYTIKCLLVLVFVFILVLVRYWAWTWHWYWYLNLYWFCYDIGLELVISIGIWINNVTGIITCPAQL